MRWQRARFFYFIHDPRHFTLQLCQAVFHLTILPIVKPPSCLIRQARRFYKEIFLNIVDCDLARIFKVRKTLEVKPWNEMLLSLFCIQCDFLFDVCHLKSLLVNADKIAQQLPDGSTDFFL